MDSVVIFKNLFLVSFQRIDSTLRQAQDDCRNGFVSLYFTFCIAGFVVNLILLFMSVCIQLRLVFCSEIGVKL